MSNNILTTINNIALMLFSLNNRKNAREVYKVIQKPRHKSKFKKSKIRNNNLVGKPTKLYMNIGLSKKDFFKITLHYKEFVYEELLKYKIKSVGVFFSKRKLH
jgi:hypothetical protein